MEKLDTSVFLNSVENIYEWFNTFFDKEYLS